MQQTGQPFLSCPVLFWNLCSSHFCITSSSRCDVDDGVNPMETVRLMLYRFLPFFRLHGVLRRSFCRSAFALPLKCAESEMNGYCRFADLNVVLISNFKLKFQLCNIGEIINIEFIGDFDIKNCEFAVQEGS